MNKTSILLVTFFSLVLNACFEDPNQAIANKKRVDVYGDQSRAKLDSNQEDKENLAKTGEGFDQEDPFLVFKNPTLEENTQEAELAFLNLNTNNVGTISGKISYGKFDTEGFFDKNNYPTSLANVPFLSFIRKWNQGTQLYSTMDSYYNFGAKFGNLLLAKGNLSVLRLKNTSPVENAVYHKEGNGTFAANYALLESLKPLREARVSYQGIANARWSNSIFDANNRKYLDSNNTSDVVYSYPVLLVNGEMLGAIYSNFSIPIEFHAPIYTQGNIAVSFDQSGSAEMAFTNIGFSNSNSESADSFNWQMSYKDGTVEAYNIYGAEDIQLESTFIYSKLLAGQVAVPSKNINNVKILITENGNFLSANKFSVGRKNFFEVAEAFIAFEGNIDDKNSQIGGILDLYQNIKSLPYPIPPEDRTGDYPRGIYAKKQGLSLVSRLRLAFVANEVSSSE